MGRVDPHRQSLGGGGACVADFEATCRWRTRRENTHTVAITFSTFYRIPRTTVQLGENLCRHPRVQPHAMPNVTPSIKEGPSCITRVHIVTFGVEGSCELWWRAQLAHTKPTNEQRILVFAQREPYYKRRVSDPPT